MSKIVLRQTAFSSAIYALQYAVTDGERFIWMYDFDNTMSFPDETYDTVYEYDIKKQTYTAIADVSDFPQLDFDSSITVLINPLFYLPSTASDGTLFVGYRANDFGFDPEVFIYKGVRTYDGGSDSYSWSWSLFFNENITNYRADAVPPDGTFASLWQYGDALIYAHPYAPSGVNTIRPYTRKGTASGLGARTQATTTFDITSWMLGHDIADLNISVGFSSNHTAKHDFVGKPDGLAPYIYAYYSNGNIFPTNERRRVGIGYTWDGGKFVEQINYTVDDGVISGPDWLDDYDGIGNDAYWFGFPTNSGYKTSITSSDPTLPSTNPDTDKTWQFGWPYDIGIDDDSKQLYKWDSVGEDWVLLYDLDQLSSIPTLPDVAMRMKNHSTWIGYAGIGLHALYGDGQTENMFGCHKWFSETFHDGTVSTLGAYTHASNARAFTTGISHDGDNGAAHLQPLTPSTDALMRTMDRGEGYVMQSHNSAFSFWFRYEDLGNTLTGTTKPLSITFSFDEGDVTHTVDIDFDNLVDGVWDSDSVDLTPHVGKTLNYVQFDLLAHPSFNYSMYFDEVCMNIEAETYHLAGGAPLQLYRGEDTLTYQSDLPDNHTTIQNPSALLAPRKEDPAVYVGVADSGQSIVKTINDTDWTDDLASVTPSAGLSSTEVDS